MMRPAREIAVAACDRDTWAHPVCSLVDAIEAAIVARDAEMRAEGFASEMEIARYATIAADAMAEVKALRAQVDEAVGLLRRSQAAQLLEFGEDSMRYDKDEFSLSWRSIDSWLDGCDAAKNGEEG